MVDICFQKLYRAKGAQRLGIIAPVISAPLALVHRSNFSWFPRRGKSTCINTVFTSQLRTARRLYYGTATLNVLAPSPSDPVAFTAVIKYVKYKTVSGWHPFLDPFIYTLNRKLWLALEYSRGCFTNQNLRRYIHCTCDHFISFFQLLCRSMIVYILSQILPPSPACFFFLIPLSHPFLRLNPDPALFFYKFLASVMEIKVI